MTPQRFRKVLTAALAARAPLAQSTDITAWRIADGAGDDIPGVYIDRYGPTACLKIGRAHV